MAARYQIQQDVPAVWLADLVTYTQSPECADLLETSRFPWKSLKKGTMLDTPPVVIGHVLDGVSEFVQVRAGGSDALVERERLQEALPDWEAPSDQVERNLAALHEEL